MITPIHEERAHTPKPMPGPPLRLRPAQAAPIRREPSGQGTTPGGWGCMDGITPAWLGPQDPTGGGMPFADDDAD